MCRQKVQRRVAELRRTTTEIGAEFLQQRQTLTMVVLRSVIHTLAVGRIRTAFEQQPRNGHSVRDTGEIKYRNTI